MVCNADCKNGEIRIRTGNKIKVKQGECIIKDFNSISADGRIYYSVQYIDNDKTGVWGEHDLEYIGESDDQRNDGASK